ncbi:hypothetical protein BMF94_5172 [Rhodotorula taiwanensis]|uniref:Uncharacterized protein n=1 Tax=Rhodotorula taiwanensis TaxID=741276 RepID=A0A2S5B521_9BASI|nr:hypothetical protein BMF94_5172 [Rhodotorula taiwanensis]
MDYVIDYLQDLTGTPLRPALGFPLPLTGLFFNPITPPPPPPVSSSSSTTSFFARRASPPPSPVALSPIASQSSSSSESPSTAATSPATSPAPPPNPKPPTGPVTRARAREMQGGAGAKGEPCSGSPAARSSPRNVKKARPRSVAGSLSAPSSRGVEATAAPRRPGKRTSAVVEEEAAALEEEPEAGSSSLPSPASAKKFKASKRESVPAPRGFRKRKERALRKKGFSGWRSPIREKPEIVTIPLDKPDASGATSFTFTFGIAECQILDSEEKGYALQKYFQERLAKKRAELKAEWAEAEAQRAAAEAPRAEKRKRASMRAAGSAPYTVKTLKARQRASTAASNSAAARHVDGSDSEGDEEVGRFAPSEAARRAGRDKVAELDSDDQATPEPRPKPKALVKARKDKERGSASRTGPRRRYQTSPSPTDSARAVPGTNDSAGAMAPAGDADDFRPREIASRIYVSGSTFCDTSFTVTTYVDGRRSVKVRKGRW